MYHCQSWFCRDPFTVSALSSGFQSEAFAFTAAKVWSRWTPTLAII